MFFQLPRYALDILWPPLAAARAKAEAEKTGPQDGLWLLRGDAQSLPFQEAQLAPWMRRSDDVNSNVESKSSEVERAKSPAQDFVWWGLGIHKARLPSASQWTQVAAG